MNLALNNNIVNVSNRKQHDVNAPWSSPTIVKGATVRTGYIELRFPGDSDESVHIIRIPHGAVTNYSTYRDPLNVLTVGQEVVRATNPKMMINITITALIDENGSFGEAIEETI